jgi:hypothetical protein
MTNNAMNEVLDALPTSEQGDPSIFVAGTGVKLKMKRVSQMIIADAKRRLPEPRIPKTYIEEKGRDEPNPQDPEYLEALAHYQYDTAMLAVRVYLIMGTEPVFIPEGMVDYKSPVWSDAILSADEGADIPESGPRRYFAWLKYYALPDDQVMQCMNRIVRYSGGALEAQVRSAQESFRGDEARDADPGLPTANEAQRGDNDRGAGDVVGNGSGVRSEGSGRLLALPVDNVDPGIQLI